MPRKRKKAKARRSIPWDQLREEIAAGRPWRSHTSTPPVLKGLVEGWTLRTPDGLAHEPELAEEVWSRLGDEITRKHAEHRPGSRPWAWWRWTSPERWRRGVCEDCREDAERTAPVRGALPGPWFGAGPFAREDCDVETEEEFLERHDLMFPVERDCAA